MKFQVKYGGTPGFPFNVVDVINVTGFDPLNVVVAAFRHHEDAQEYVDFLTNKYGNS
jgi:hypothetical protein